MNLQIAICDEDKRSGRMLERWLTEYAEEIRLDFNITVYNHETIYRWYMEHNIWHDIVFIDICFPERNGIELGKRIRKYWGRKTVNIIFVTFYRECCCDLFEIEPLNVHLKPLQKEKLYQDVQKVLRRGTGNKCILEYMEDRMVKAVRFRDIMYVKAADKKLVVKTQSKEICIRDSLDHLEKRCRCSGFCRCHRSYLVNMEWIKSYRNRKIGLRDGSVIPVGDKYGVAVRKALEWFAQWRW